MLKDIVKQIVTFSNNTGKGILRKLIHKRAEAYSVEVRVGRRLVYYEIFEHADPSVAKSLASSAYSTWIEKLKR